MEYQIQITKNNINEIHVGWTNYLTHDNGNRPFSIWISPDTVTVRVYKQDWNNSDSEDPFSSSNYTKLIKEFKCVNVFVGISQLNNMTSFSAGHGLLFEGNSILLNLGNNQYVFIGQKIFSFRTNHEIVNYMSPVGNNDVPYPYAIDSQGDCYLMIEDAVIRVDDPTKLDDPYVYYYKILEQIREYEGIEHMEINGEIYNFNSHPNPSKTYDDLTKRLGSPIYIKFRGQEKRIISKQEYIGILTQYNNSIGLSPLKDYHLIEKRDW